MSELGDRSSIVIIFPQGRIYAYTHWRGDRLDAALRVALNQRTEDGRRMWSEHGGAYLARRIFCRLVSGDEKGMFGFALSPFRVAIPDYPELHVDVDEQEVRKVEVVDVQVGEDWALEERVLAVWCFEDFAAGKLPPAVVDNAADVGVVP